MVARLPSPSRHRPRPWAVVVPVLMLLSACADASGLVPRNGPQAESVSVQTAIPTGTAAVPVSAVPAAATDPAQALFAEFCLPYDTAAASEAAVLASGRFGPVQETLIGGEVRFATYPVLGMDRASVTLVTNSGSRIQCGVGVNNVGPTLYEDGRIG